MDQGLLDLADLFATQFGTLVIMPGDEGPEDHAENETQGLPALSSSSLEASTLASTPRDHARNGLWEERIGEASHPGLETRRFLMILDDQHKIARWPPGAVTAREWPAWERCGR